jgi:CheY-like chemotaxis protein
MILSPGTRPTQTILFVDDDPSLLEARSLVFEAMGYRVLTAVSGEAALERLQMDSVDAVILDYWLPGMNGEEIARMIRTEHANIIIILSSGGFSLAQPGMEMFSALVSKAKGPVALLEVLERQLQSVLENGAPQEAAPALSRVECRH